MVSSSSPHGVVFREVVASPLPHKRLLDQAQHSFPFVSLKPITIEKFKYGTLVGCDYDGKMMGWYTWYVDAECALIMLMYYSSFRFVLEIVFLSPDELTVFK